MKDPDLGELVAFELARGEQARQAGNFGRARVCARRAAGWALGGKPTSRGGQRGGKSRNAYQALLSAGRDEALPAPVRDAAARLTSRLDESFSLPFDEDPIEDAVEIIRWCWPGWRQPAW